MTDQERVTNSAILNLIEGYKLFKAENFESSKTFENLVENGQQPKVLMIACCDSRVDPAIVTGCQPGEIFVVRNVANLVPPFKSDPMHHGTSAALEFGVLGLKVSDIIVFGHSHCGGIRSLMEGTAAHTSTDFIQPWMSIATPAKDRVLRQYAEENIDEQAGHCEREALKISLQNLKTFPWINARVKNRQLYLHAWHIDLRTGVIESYRENQKCFIPLDDTAPKDRESDRRY